jgi:hypothetical protein
MFNIANEFSMTDYPTFNDINKSEFDLNNLYLENVAFYGRTLSEYLMFFWHK